MEVEMNQEYQSEQVEVEQVATIDNDTQEVNVEDEVANGDTKLLDDGEAINIVTQPTEMANDEIQPMRAEYNEESIDDHQTASTMGTFTDLFNCEKCGSNNCSYTQLQLGSHDEDEPMTTVGLCNECGSRWKLC